MKPPGLSRRSMTIVPGLNSERDISAFSTRPGMLPRKSGIRRYPTSDRGSSTLTVGMMSSDRSIVKVSLFPPSRSTTISTDPVSSPAIAVAVVVKP